MMRLLRLALMLFGSHATEPPDPKDATPPPPPQISENVTTEMPIITPPSEQKRPSDAPKESRKEMLARMDEMERHMKEQDAKLANTTAELRSLRKLLEGRQIERKSIDLVPNLAEPEDTSG